MSTKGPSLSQLEALLTAEGDVPENAFSQLADFLKDSQSIYYEAFASQSVEAFASFPSQFLNDEVDLPTHPDDVPVEASMWEQDVGEFQSTVNILNAREALLESTPSLASSTPGLTTRETSPASLLSWTRSPSSSVSSRGSSRGKHPRESPENLGSSGDDSSEASEDDPITLGTRSLREAWENIWVTPPTLFRQVLYHLGPTLLSQD